VPRVKRHLAQHRLAQHRLAQHRLAVDRGAAAVEMAIVTPLLLLLLFGIIQYGMLFHALQGASATARDAARQAALGVADCGAFLGYVTTHAQADGVPAGWAVTMSYTPSVRPTTTTVHLTFTPTAFVPFIPMPGTMTRDAIASIEDPSAIQVTQCPPP
jgi:TadE-like protein